MYITYLIIFSLFGAFYGALSYGLNSQFIGDLPRCVDDNASFYIIKSASHLVWGYVLLSSAHRFQIDIDSILY